MKRLEATEPVVTDKARVVAGWLVGYVVRQFVVVVGVAGSSLDECWRLDCFWAEDMTRPTINAGAQTRLIGCGSDVARVGRYVCPLSLGRAASPG